jgi:hypothetical protein
VKVGDVLILLLSLYYFELSNYLLIGYNDNVCSDKLTVMADYTLGTNNM